MPPRRPASQVERARAFGNELQRLRDEAGLKQREVAEKVPIDPGHLSRLERGRYGPPSDETIEKLATVLSVDPVHLLHIAGRELTAGSFQQRVLADLEQLRNELRDGFERLDATLARLDDS